jgi:hypothetical protein
LKLLARTLLLAAAAVFGWAAPAAADPARPTDYQSTIDSIEPPAEGVEVSIVGGDAFIRLEVEPGHTVVVEGYQGEPYLQFLEDGTVQQNQRSEATYLNEDRYADIEVPSDLSPDDEPEWRTVDDDGEYAWHDHRIHWMSPDRPEGVEEGDVVQTQDVLMVVDGTPTAVTVSVTLEEGVSPLPWLALGAAAFGAVAALGWRRRSLPVAVGAALFASILAVIAGRAEYAAVPSGAGGSALVVVVPAIATVAALVAAVLLWRGKPAPAGIALLASAAALAGWAFLRLAVLWKPVLPTELPAGLDRLATTLAVAGAVAVAALTLHSGAVTPAPITDDEQ